MVSELERQRVEEAAQHLQRMKGTYWNKRELEATDNIKENPAHLGPYSMPA
jgi:hypothetical protein